MTALISGDNSTFDTSLGDWVPGNFLMTTTRVTSPTPHAGSGVMMLQRNAPFAINPAAMLPGTVWDPGVTGDYTLSAWVREDPGNTASAVDVILNFGSDTTAIFSIPSGSWQQIQLISPDVGSPHADMGITFYKASGTAAGDRYYVSDVQIDFVPDAPATRGLVVGSMTLN